MSSTAVINYCIEDCPQIIHCNASRTWEINIFILNLNKGNQEQSKNFAKSKICPQESVECQGSKAHCFQLSHFTTSFLIEVKVVNTEFSNGSSSFYPIVSCIVILFREPLPVFNKIQLLIQISQDIPRSPQACLCYNCTFPLFTCSVRSPSVSTLLAKLISATKMARLGCDLPAGLRDSPHNICLLCFRSSSSQSQLLHMPIVSSVLTLKLQSFRGTHLKNAFY